MNISKRKQGILAIICTIAMIVTSITVYNPREVKAAASGSGNGMKYTVSGESQEGGLIGFACNEVKIHNTVDGYMHFAWSGENAYQVVPKTIKAQIDGVDVKTYNSNPSDTFIGYSQFKDLEVGEHQIKISGTTSAGAKEIYATATLKIEKVEGTAKPSAPEGLVAHIDATKTNYTIAFAAVSGAESYKFYLNGEYIKDITNGGPNGIVTIEELGLEAGKTYKFGVSAVNAAGEESDITTIDVTAPGQEEETTTGSSTKPFDPSDIKDSEWTLALNSKTVSYYIADNKSDKVNVKPQLEGDNYYVAFTIPATFKSVTFDGVSKDVTDGGYYRVKVSDLTSGYHTLVVTDYYGKESVTIYFKVAEGEGTTTPSFEEGKELIPSEMVNAEITLEKHTVGQTEYVQEHKAKSIHIESGKWYVGQFTITSSVRKYFEIRVQDAAEYVSIPANTEFKKVLVEAGQTVNVRVRFKADRTTDSAIFDICMGYIKEESEAGKVQITNNSLKGYTNEPEATKYTVSIDGTEKQYEEGATIAVPADGQGYYNVTKKEAYAPGTELTVNENMTLKSIKLSVTMTKGASIRLAAPTGLRFQTTVTSGNGIAADEILNSPTVTTGTLITTLASYEDNGNTLTKDSKYTFLDIENAGWFNNGTSTETGKFCGSIIKIQKENYDRPFIAVGYATINYSNGKPKTVYADVTANNAKSIQGVAKKIQGSAAYNKYTPAQQNIINKYINKEEISK